MNLVGNQSRVRNDVPNACDVTTGTWMFPTPKRHEMMGVTCR